MVTGKINHMLEKFHLLYEAQEKFQSKIEGIKVEDNPDKFQYHITALQEEMGEVLKADKRWKTHRNAHYNQREKLDELADCYITLMNISMWSGFSSSQILNEIDRKIKTNNKRLERGSNNE